MGRRTVSDKLVALGFVRTSKVNSDTGKPNRRYNNKERGVTIECQPSAAGKSRTGTIYNRWVQFNTKNPKNHIRTNDSLASLLVEVAEDFGIELPTPESKAQALVAAAQAKAEAAIAKAQAKAQKLQEAAEAKAAAATARAEARAVKEAEAARVKEEKAAARAAKKAEKEAVAAAKKLARVAIKAEKEAAKADVTEDAPES